MKKTIGILSVVLIAAVMFAKATTISKNTNITLSSLISLTNANAEYDIDKCAKAFERCDAEYPDDYHLFDACMFGAGC